MHQFPVIILFVSESAKFAGVSTRTIRRLILKKALTYTVVKERYRITLDSLLAYALKTPNMQKKLQKHGFGAFVREWDSPKGGKKESSSPSGS